MEQFDIVEGLAALAHARRLGIFRLLMTAVPGGLSAGDIARRTATPPSTLSHHLAQLEQAGLIRSRRRERNVFYTADVEGTRRLIDSLLRDCCAGEPGLCGFAEEGTRHDRDDLAQPAVRDLAKHPGDDPQLR